MPYTTFGYIPVFTHPDFSNQHVDINLISLLFFEVFIMIIPYERRDINVSSDKFKISRGPIKENDRFFAIFDQTYGSLRLSGRFLELNITNAFIDKAVSILNLYVKEGKVDCKSETYQTSLKLINLLKEPYEDFSFEFDKDISRDQNRYQKIIKPNSKGLDVSRNNEEFFIDGVYFNPQMNSLAYRGYHISESSNRYSNILIAVPINSIIEIPGESEIGLYDFSTGLIIDPQKL